MICPSLMIIYMCESVEVFFVETIINDTEIVMSDLSLLGYGSMLIPK